jgi:transcriptional antiterminator NusG
MSESNSPEMKWYIIQTQSGFEAKACTALRETAKRFGMQDHLGEVIVPTENVVEVKNGEKTQRPVKFLPSYVLAQMNLTKEMWHVVKETPRIIGFVGGKTDPPAVSQKEVDKIRGHMEEGMKAPKPVLSFRVGDQVKVVDGPFKNFLGTVEEVNSDKAKVRVLVSIFGRATPVELDFVQVEPTA